MVHLRRKKKNKNVIIHKNLLQVNQNNQSHRSFVPGPAGNVDEMSHFLS